MKQWCDEPAPNVSQSEPLSAAAATT